MEYKIDATNKSLGRLATEVAVILMGKSDIDFARNTISKNTVTVENASKLKISDVKRETKTYNSFSGYPGGLKQTSMKHTIEKKGYKAIVETAIKGMLPDNKLKKEMMKHLTVQE